MDSRAMKDAIAGTGKWSEAYTRMFHKLFDAHDPVSVAELSRLVAPEKFRPNTFVSVNALLEIRGLPFRLEMIEKRRGCKWEELEVKIVLIS